MWHNQALYVYPICQLNSGLAFANKFLMVGFIPPLLNINHVEHNPLEHNNFHLTHILN